MIAIHNADKTADFLLASLLTAYPDETFADNVEAVLAGGEAEITDVMKEKIISVITSPSAIDDLRSEYIDRFDRGKSANPLYETEYGRDRALAKGHELADISGFYKAFGLEFECDGIGKEMIDHVSVELEFYTLLMMKEKTLKEAFNAEGVEVVSSARKKFLKEHLGRFVGAIADRPGVQSSEFYSLVFNWCKAIVEQEGKALGIELDSANWYGRDVMTDEQLLCGGSSCSKSEEKSCSD